MVKALLIHKDDNVAVVISQVKENDEVVYVDKDNNSRSIIANGSIPQYHKIAIRDIKKMIMWLNTENISGLQVAI